MSAFDTVYVIANNVGTLLCFPINIFLLAESKQTFDSVTNGKTTTEISLMIDLLAARDPYRQYEIYPIELVRGEQNSADGLRKIKDNRA